jgi:hypothetical protein
MVLEAAAQIITAIIGYVKDGIKATVDLIVSLIQILEVYIQTIGQVFPFDNPKKTMMLALIWIIFVIACVMVFSASPWTLGGVTSMKPINYGFSLKDAGTMQAAGESNTSGGNMTTPKGASPTNCYSDQDCQNVGGEDVSDEHLLCCTPDEYEGYSCAGHCLKYANAPRDWCKHPAACYFEGDFNSFAGDTSRRCDLRADLGQLQGLASATKWCQTHSSNYVGIDPQVKCCAGTQDMISPCYGYCTISGSGYDCADAANCYEQNQLIVQALNGTDA